MNQRKKKKEKGNENGPLLSCLKPPFKSETKYEVIDMKLIFYSVANKTHFQNKGFPLSLLLKVGVWNSKIAL